jgi:SAM-dependent methyltransferase
MLDGKRLNLFEKLAYKILGLTDIENRTLRGAVEQFARSVQPGAKVLDAAAGLKPYQQYFAHCEYESCDFANCQEFYGNLDDGHRENLAARHTYVCPIDSIPVPDYSYDVVLCTQVLEHVPYPAAALRELHRVLRDSGRLFVTVPQGFGIHGEPYNFFYFTKYGLELILKDAGFEVLTVRERGGYFYYLYDRLANAIPRIVVDYKKHMSFMILVLSPIHIFLAYLLGPALLLLEPLDREKRFTLGYTSTALKKSGTSKSDQAPNTQAMRGEPVGRP